MTIRPRLGYLAHPFGGDFAKLAEASVWVAVLNHELNRRGVLIVVWAPWIPLCRHWPDNGESRALGLGIDLAAVVASDFLYLTGGRHLTNREIAGGMALELATAKEHRKHVVDLLDLAWPTDFPLSPQNPLDEKLDQWLVALTELREAQAR
jgi:hypothetical protein